MIFEWRENFKRIRSFVLGLLLAISATAASAQGSDEAVQPEPSVEEQALTVLYKHCASCHSGNKKEGNFNFVLDLEKLVGTPRYITPRHPEFSLLMNRITSGTMPPSGSAKLTVDERKSIENWILQAETKREIAAAKRDVISYQDILDAIKDDLDLLPVIERKRTRYLTLHHLYNAGDSGKEMELWRRAASKVINSLSWQSMLIPKRLGPKKTVLRINLDDLRWPDVVWDRLLAIYPYGIEPERDAKDIARRTETPQPFIRADWFAFHATQPPLYYELLGLPAKTLDLENLLGVDVKRNIARYRAKRAGFRESGVSQNNRLIERHNLSHSSGAYWKSYDFAGNAGRQSIFDFPLGPGGDFGFAHDGGEIIFNLPNGMQAYYLEDAKGNRIDRGPTNIVRDKSRPETPEIISGLSCIGCHFDGMILTPDQVRDRVLATKSFPRDVRRQVEELYAPWDTMRKDMLRDMRRYLSALEEAGVIKGYRQTDDGGFKVDRVIDGKEAIRALADRYEETVTLLQAAGELGLSLTEFEATLDISKDEVRQIRTELARGTLPRDTFEQKFGHFIDNMLELRPLDHRATCRQTLSRTTQQRLTKSPYIENCVRIREYDAVFDGEDVGSNTPINHPQVSLSNGQSDESNNFQNHSQDLLFDDLKVCFQEAEERLRRINEYKEQIVCAEDFLRKAPSDHSEQALVNEILAELNSDLSRLTIPVVDKAAGDEYKDLIPSQPKKEKPKPTVARFNGTFSAVRGYTNGHRPSPNKECLSRYSFEVEVHDGQLSFWSDGRSWRGRIDKHGNISISRNDISPRPRSAFSVRGNLTNADMKSGYCGTGYFRIAR
ncbi:MAG: hypothetical protein NXI17_23360 [Alphaproteobacteria bacterium]|nr:hypothetical protein [Alphaproteobacteria bacterium]